MPTVTTDPLWAGGPTRPRRALRLTAAAVLLSSLATLGAGPSPVPAGAQAGTGTWTVIYYGVADNDLEAALTADVAEMTQAGFGDEVAMYGLIDRSPIDYSDPYGEFVDGPLGALGDFAGTKAFRVIGDDLVEDLDLGEVDMADPDTLAWFVAEVMRVSPTDHTALIMSDHGAGAYAFGVDEGAVEDEGDAPTSMDAQEIAVALRTATADAGRPLDVLAFDACLMANFEMTAWLSGSADLLVASEDLVPGFGFRYQDLVGLTQDPSMDPLEFAGLLVDSFGEQYASSDFAATSLSVTDLSTAQLLDRAVSGLATALAESEYHVGFQAATADSSSVLALDDVYGFVDLGDLARRLAQPGNPEAVRIAADAVFAAVDRAVVDEWGGLARDSATGMSIAIPTDPEVFEGLRYAVLGNPDWAEWLSSVFEAAEAVDSTDTLWQTDVPDVELLDESGIVISARLDADVVAEQGLVDATGLFGMPTADGGMEVYLYYPAVTDSGERGLVRSSWAYQVFALTDGETTQYPSTLLLPNEAVINARINGTYTAGGTDHDAVFEFVLDAQGGGITEVRLLVFDEQGGAWGSISPVVGSTFSPIVYQVSPDGSSIDEVLLDPLSFDAGVEVSELTVNPGVEISAGLLASDSAGTPWTVFGSTERP